MSGRRRRRSSSARPRTPTSACWACRRTRRGAGRTCVRVRRDPARAARRRVAEASPPGRRRRCTSRACPWWYSSADVAPSRRPPPAPSTRTGTRAARAARRRPSAARLVDQPLEPGDEPRPRRRRAPACRRVERRDAVVGVVAGVRVRCSYSATAVHRAARRPPRTPATPRDARDTVGVGARAADRARRSGTRRGSRPRSPPMPAISFSQLAADQQPEVERERRARRCSGSGPRARPAPRAARRRRRLGRLLVAGRYVVSRVRRRRGAWRAPASPASSPWNSPSCHCRVSIHSASRTSARSARSKSCGARPALEPVPQRDRREAAARRARRRCRRSASDQPSRASRARATPLLSGEVGRDRDAVERHRASPSRAGSARSGVASTCAGSTARSRARSSVSSQRVDEVVPAPARRAVGRRDEQHGLRRLGVRPVVVERDAGGLRRARG